MPPTSSSGPTVTTSERYTRALAASLAACSQQARGYGQCMSGKLPEIEKGCCDREFQALKACFFKEFKNRRKG